MFWIKLINVVNWTRLQQVVLIKSDKGGAFFFVYGMFLYEILFLIIS